MGRVFKWLLAEGGLAAIERRNDEKARVLYDYLDGEDVLHGAGARGQPLAHERHLPHAEPGARQALRGRGDRGSGSTASKGHRSAGGMRASIYNAFPRAGCEALVSSS